MYRGMISDAVKEYEWMPRESRVVEYQGFDVILPTNMTKDKPFLYLKKNGKYYVELGLADKGVLVRIDHVLNGLKSHFRKLRESWKILRRRGVDLKKELATDYGHSDAILQLTEKIEELDEKLGVKNYAS